MVLKKPTLPSAATEIGDYFIMSDFVANSTAGLETISGGTLRKNFHREALFASGTGGTTAWIYYPASVDPTTRISGQDFLNDQLNAYIEYMFWGTGFDLRGITYSTTSDNIRISLQNLTDAGSLLAATTTNFPTMVTSVYGTGNTFTASTGILDTKDASTVSGRGFILRNLPLKLWKVRIENLNSGSSNYMEMDCIDIITPVHSPKSNLYASLQNVLTIGNCGISDNRKFTPLKSELSKKKIYAQAIGYGSNPSTTSSVYIPLTHMSVTVTVDKVTDLNIRGNVTVVNPANNGISLAPYLNGAIAGEPTFVYATAGMASAEAAMSVDATVTVGPGTHKIDLYYNSSSGGAATVERRTLIVTEI
jgi:hypothetical protein